MKVALVAEWVDTWRGGAETSTQQFLRHLIDYGVEVHLYTRSRPSPAPGLHVHTINGSAMLRSRQTWTFMHRVQRAVAEDTFDVVHAISPCRGATVYQPRGGTIAETIERNLALLRSRRVRSLKRYANHFNLKQRGMLAAERRMMRNPEGPIVIAISDYVVRQLREHYDLPEQRIVRIYNGVDPDTSTPDERRRDRRRIRTDFGIDPHDLLVVVVAHNFRLKGVQHWIEAQGQLARRGSRDIRSLVIGKGDSELWHRFARRAGAAPFLTFVGPTDRIRAFYHAADVLVHPTYYDPCSRVVLEGMSSGLPCITTHWDGAAEQIEDSVNGFVLDNPRDVDALVDRLERLRDADLRGTMSRLAQEAAEGLSMERHCREVLGLYQRLAAQGAQACPTH